VKKNQPETKKSAGNGKKRKSTTNAKRNSKLRKSKNSEQFLNTESAGVCTTGRDWSLRRKDKSLRNRKRLEFALGKTKRKKRKTHGKRHKKELVV
jgi:hypothetical protein